MGGIIYKATNVVNGKSYIGVTSDYIRRKNRHKYDALINNIETYFHRSIRKYGWDNFEWSIIFESDDYQYTKNVMEPKFITQYDTLVEGYNMSSGGEGAGLGNKNGRGLKGTPHTKEHSKAISQALMGHISKQRQRIKTPFGEYDSLLEASKHLNLSYDIVKYRIRRDNYPDWSKI